MSGLREALRRIYDEHGQLTPKLVVDLARDEGHELHGHFEWDDTVAAEKYRQAQAAQLIRVVRIKTKDGDEKTPPTFVRAFHNVPDQQGNRVYEPAEEVAQDEFKRELVLREMERDWKTLKRRWAGWSEFIELVRQDVAA